MWWIIGGIAVAVVYAVVLLFFKGVKMLNEAYDEADRTGQ